jgi:hypothetical protein
LVEAGRNIWSSHVRTFALQQGWLDPALALLDTTPDQPYLLHCIGAHLRAIGDPDWAVFTLRRRHNYVTGVNLGVLDRLPRTPAVFERKLKNRVYDDPWDGHAASKENYRTVKGRVEEIRKQFYEEKAVRVQR